MTHAWQPTTVGETSPPRSILILEDNETLALGLRTSLEVEGYKVDCVVDGDDGLRWLEQHEPDLIVLDLMLPKMDGYLLLRAVRGEGLHMPVLILTARSDEAEKVRGFRWGADDYVTKPFSLIELLARVDALLRRSRQSTTSTEANDAAVRFGTIEVHPSKRLVLRQGAPVSLRPKEFDLLMALVRRDGSVAQRSELLREVWGYKPAMVSRTIDTHIVELRRKLEDDPSSPRHFLTVRKTGYRFER